MRDDAETFLKSKAHALSVLLERDAGDLSGIRSEINWSLPELQYTRFYARIFSHDGKLIVETKGATEEIGPPPSSATEFEKFRTPQLFRSPHGRPVLQYVTGSSILVAIDLHRSEETLDRQKIAIQILFAVSAVIVFVIGFGLSRIATEPIQRLVAQTRTLDRPGAAPLQPDSYPSELQPLVAALNSLHQRLGDQIKSLSRFAENVAHEMRNPINILIGECELTLSKKRPVQDYEETLHSALEEYRDLARLIDSLLFIARAENQAEAIHRSRTSASALVEDVAEFYRPLADEAGTQLLVQIPEDLLLDADPLLVRRALGNLISNAIEHGKNGGTVQILGNRGTDSTSICVRDDGPGIPREHLPKLFERFFRVFPERRAGEFRGIGLGLPIVKSIMELHGGTVNVDSEEGKGARFELIFPDWGS